MKLLSTEYTWRVDAKASDTFTGCKESYYYKYQLIGDTLIDGNSLSKLYRTDTEIRNNMDDTCYVWHFGATLGYVGAIEQNENDRIVYLVRKGKLEKEVLFNYNLKVGDTLRSTLSSGVGCPDIVQSLDPLIIGSETYLKWTFLDCGDNESHVIEGIGTSWGLVEKMKDQGFLNSFLVYVSIDSVPYYSANVNSDIGCKEVNNIATPKGLSWKIYPNPSTGIFNIESKGEKGQWQILNSTGQITRSGKGAVIDLSDKSRGVYFLWLISEGRTPQYYKLIKF
jgi:hypothetical protein